MYTAFFLLETKRKRSLFSLHKEKRLIQKYCLFMFEKKRGCFSCKTGDFFTNSHGLEHKPLMPAYPCTVFLLITLIKITMNRLSTLSFVPTFSKIACQQTR